MSLQPKRDNTWLWVSVGILGTSLALGTIYYYNQRKKWLAERREEERLLSDYLTSAIRFTEQDFAFMTGLIDQCRNSNTKQDDINGCIYKQLTIYINQVKKGTPIQDWEQDDIRKFIEFLKQNGLGNYTAQYEIYLRKKIKM